MTRFGGLRPPTPAALTTPTIVAANDHTPVAPHPAKFSTEVLDILSGELAYIVSKYQRNIRVLDPFAGVGGVHLLMGPRVHTYAVEIEPEWAVQSATLGPTNCSDFFDFEPKAAYDVICTSPTYGNRMADHHDAKDASTRITYKHKLGRDPSVGSSATLQWGREYRRFHGRAWIRAVAMLADDGWFLLNVSDHVRKGEVVHVVDWHREMLRALGMELVRDHEVETRRMGFGANRDVRVDCEHVMVFRRGS